MDYNEEDDDMGTDEEDKEKETKTKEEKMEKKEKSDGKKWKREEDLDEKKKRNQNPEKEVIPLTPIHLHLKGRRMWVLWERKGKGSLIRELRPERSVMLEICK